MSPDARWIGRAHNGKIEIRLLAGGDWVPTPAPIYSPNASTAAFTQDGNWLLYRVNGADDKIALYRVSTSREGQPERIGDLPGTCKTWCLTSLYVSPDSRTAIASVANPGAFNSAELSILENFEPKQQAAK